MSNLKNKEKSKERPRKTWKKQTNTHGLNTQGKKTNTGIVNLKNTHEDKTYKIKKGKA